MQGASQPRKNTPAVPIIRNLAMRLAGLRFHPLFVDEIVVHAPAEDTSALWREFLEQRNLHPGPGDPGHLLDQVAVDSRPAWSLFWKRLPKLVCYAVEPASETSARLRLQPGPGDLVGRTALLLCALLAAGLNAAFALLLANRDRLGPSGDLASTGLLLPLLVILGGYWVVGFWLSTRLTAGRRFAAEFGQFLTERTGIHHTSAQFPNPAWRESIAFLIAVLALAAVIGQLSFSALASPRDAVFLVATSGALFLIIGVYFVSGPSLVRWLTGHAAFIASVALALQNIFPLLLAAIAFDQLRSSNADLPISHPSIPQFASLGLAAIAIFLGEVVLLAFAARAGFVLARSLDYWHARTETYRGQTTPRRLLLILAAAPCALLAGFFLLLAFLESAVFVQDWLLGRHRLIRSALLFEYAAAFVTWMAGQCARPLGLAADPRFVSECFWVCHCAPVLLWGGSQLLLAADEVRLHIKCWRRGQPAPAPEQAKRTCDLAASIAASARIRPPVIRFEDSLGIHARAVISPIPGLPRIIVLSTGAVAILPWANLRALLAHEIGHIKLGHTRLYSFLGLVSRVLLLGPAFLTGMIRTPDRLEAEADRFAVTWLEAHGGSREDLIAALSLAEQQRFLGLLHPQGPEGVMMHHGAPADWLPPKLREVLAGAEALPWHRRVAGGWRLLYHLTMHAGLASYVHLPLPERVVIIRQLPRN